MYEVETIANDDQRKLVGQFGFLQEVLHSFGVITIWFAANAFHFFDLARFACSLNVLEVDFLVLGEVYDRTEEIEQTCKKTLNILSVSCQNRAFY